MSISTIRSCRWFLLLWVGVIYLWNFNIGDVKNGALNGDEIIFTLLIVLHIVLYWISLAWPMRRKWHHHSYAAGNAARSRLVKAPVELAA